MKTIIVAGLMLLAATTTQAQERNYSVESVFPGVTSRANPQEIPRFVPRFITVSRVAKLCWIEDPQCANIIKIISDEAANTQLCDGRKLQVNYQGVLEAISSAYEYANMNAVDYVRSTLAYGCRIAKLRD